MGEHFHLRNYCDTCNHQANTHEIRTRLSVNVFVCRFGIGIFSLLELSSFTPHCNLQTNRSSRAQQVNSILRCNSLYPAVQEFCGWIKLRFPYIFYVYFNAQWLTWMRWVWLQPLATSHNSMLIDAFAIPFIYVDFWNCVRSRAPCDYSTNHQVIWKSFHSARWIEIARVCTFRLVDYIVVSHIED